MVSRKCTVVVKLSQSAFTVSFEPRRNSVLSVPSESRVSAPPDRRLAGEAWSLPLVSSGGRGA